MDSLQRLKDLVNGPLKDFKVVEIWFKSRGGEGPSHRWILVHNDEILTIVPACSTKWGEELGRVTVSDLTVHGVTWINEQVSGFPRLAYLAEGNSSVTLYDKFPKSPNLTHRK